MFEDGRTGTKYFKPGDKVYVTGVPENDTYSLVSLSVNARHRGQNGENDIVEIFIPDGLPVELDSTPKHVAYFF